MSRTPHPIETRPFKVQAKRTKGPYPPVKRDEWDEEERKLRKVRKARKLIPLKERAPATKLMDERKPSGDPGDDPVRFYKYTRPCLRTWTIRTSHSQANPSTSQPMPLPLGGG